MREQSRTMHHMPKPVILVFTTAYAPLIGGAEIAAREIMRRLSECHFIVLTARMSWAHPSREHNGHIEIVRFGPPGAFGKILLPVNITIYVWRRFRRTHGNMVLWGVMISYASIAAYILKRMWPGVRLVMTLQEGDSETHITKRHGGLIAFFHARILPLADQIQAISTYLAARARYFAPHVPVAVVPNGVDIEMWKRDTRAPDIFSASSYTHRIMSVSRLVYKNGIDTLIDAIAMLPRAELFVVGDGPLRSALATQADRLGIRARVHFIGAIAYEQLPAYVRSAPLFVRPSRSEGLGTAFIEAMAAGRAVIATPVGGIPDIIIHEQNGLLVSPDRPEALALAVGRLMEHPETVRALQSAAEKTIQSTYTWADIARRMQQLFYVPIS